MKSPCSLLVSVGLFLFCKGQSDMCNSQGHSQGWGQSSSPAKSQKSAKASGRQSSQLRPGDLDLHLGSPSTLTQWSMSSVSQSPVSALLRTWPRRSRYGGGGGSPQGPLEVPGVTGAPLCVFHLVRGAWVTSTRKLTKPHVVVHANHSTPRKLR